MLLSGTVMSTGGCSMYSSKADEKKYFYGLYELDTYSAKHSADEENPYDRKADEGVVAYFTVSEDGYGYYGYKDKNTAARVTPVYSTFVADDEKTDLYKAIIMKDGVTHLRDPERKVGCLDEPTFGFRRYEKVIKDRPWPFKDETKMECTLAWTIPHYVNPFNKKEEIQYQYACYKKIADEPSLAKLNELLGTSYVAKKPFELGALNGFSVYYYQTKTSPSEYVSPYEYAILDCESYADGKLTLYYSEVANPGKKSMQVPVTITAPGAFKITAFGKEFVANGSPTSLSNYLNVDYESYSETDLLSGQWFSHYITEATTVDEVIAELTK